MNYCEVKRFRRAYRQAATPKNARIIDSAYLLPTLTQKVFRKAAIKAIRL
jgi:hypothetical protein